MASSRIRRTNRVFLDSSVLIAASISSRGTARDLILQALGGNVELFISPKEQIQTSFGIQAATPDEVIAQLADSRRP